MARSTSECSTSEQQESVTTRPAAQSKAFVPGAEILLAREPANTHDPNAVQVIDAHRNCVGYVPRGAAAQMSALLDSIGGEGTVGVVTKTYTVGGVRKGMDVLAAVERVIEMAGKVEGKEPGGSDDGWRRK